MKKTRILASVLALAMCFSAMPMSAFAFENRNEQVTVEMEVPSQFTVKIPKSIVIDGEVQTHDYTVEVSGDIAGNQKVTVKPDASFEMYATEKDAITAYVTQKQTQVLSPNVAAGAILNGHIDASEATAGYWNGTFYFNIKSEEVETQDFSWYINYDLVDNFKFENEMTWAEWVDSPYNNNEYEFTNTGDSITCTHGVVQEMTTNIAVKPSDTIGALSYGPQT